jgi:hypothetical protein
VKTTFAASAFALLASLAGLSHAAGFNDQVPVLDTRPTPMERQDLSSILVIHDFNQQSPHAPTAWESARRPKPGPVQADAHCHLAPRAGFQNSISVASC